MELMKYGKPHHMIWPLEMVPWSMRETDAIRNGVDHALYNLWNMVPNQTNNND